MKNSIILLFCTVLCGCYKPSMYDPMPNDSNLVNIIPIKPEIYANGVDQDSIRIEIPAKTDPARRSVILRTSLGKFVETDAQTLTISVDKVDVRYPDKRIEYISLKSGLQIGNATLTASLQNNQNSSKITFKFDSATVVKVEADKFFIGDFAEANIKATVSKSKSGKGKPTAGQKVFFSAATDSLGKNLKGYFRAVNSTTDDTSSASAIYACDSTYKGEIYIIAKIAIGLRDTVYSRFKIFKTKP